MRRDFLDRWSPLESPIHDLPPTLKLVMSFAIIVATALAPFPSLWAFGTLAAALALVATVSRVPATFLLGRLLLLEPFVLGLAVMAVFQPGGSRVALAITTRSTLCLATLILLTSTTPFS